MTSDTDYQLQVYTSCNT